MPQAEPRGQHLLVVMLAGFELHFCFTFFVSVCRTRIIVEMYHTVGIKRQATLYFIFFVKNRKQRR